MGTAIKCLQRTEAELLVRHCLTDGQVIFGSHFREELAKERLEISDAKYVLKHGHIFREPEIDIKTGEWKYRIEGKTPDGERLGIVFSFKAIDACFVITVFAVT